MYLNTRKDAESDQESCRARCGRCVAKFSQRDVRKCATNSQENSDVDLICLTGKADTLPGWLKALDLDQYESSMMANGFDDINFLVGLRLVISLTFTISTRFLCLYRC